MEGLDSISKMTLQDFRRFWDKVEVMLEVSSPHVDTPCWHWTGSIATQTSGMQGYGTFARPDGKTMRAHRESYKFFIGAIPKGMVLLHACDNPQCVNPNHLAPGTHQENMEDAVAKGRLAGSKKFTSGANHPGSTFTEREVKRIRLLYKHGRTPSHIAKMYQRPLQTIKDIVYGVTWKELLEEKETKENSKRDVVQPESTEKKTRKRKLFTKNPENQGK